MTVPKAPKTSRRRRDERLPGSRKSWERKGLQGRDEPAGRSPLVAVAAHAPTPRAPGPALAGAPHSRQRLHTHGACAARRPATQGACASRRRQETGRAGPSYGRRPGRRSRRTRRARGRAEPTPRQAPGRASCREAHAGSASPWLAGTQGPLLRVLGGAAGRPRAMGRRSHRGRRSSAGRAGPGAARCPRPFPARGGRESSQRL